MSAGLQQSRAVIRISARHDEFTAGLNEVRKQTRQFESDIKGLKNIGGFEALSPAMGQLSGTIGGVTGGLTSLLSLNPASWAMASVGAVYALCDSLVKLDQENHRALLSAERLAILYGQEIGPKGLQRAAVDMSVGRQIGGVVDAEGGAAAHERVRKELRELRAEYRKAEQAARDFGWSQQEVNDLATGKYEAGYGRFLKDQMKLGFGSNYSDDAVSRGAKLQGLTDRIAALDAQEKQLRGQQDQGAAARLAERVKWTDELTASTKRAAEAAQKAEDARAATAEDKAAVQRIQDDPTAELRAQQAAEAEAMTQEAAAREKINALAREAAGLEERKNALTAADAARMTADAARMTEIKAELQENVVLREQATAEAARALRLGEQASQEIKKQLEERTEEIKKAADEAANHRETLENNLHDHALNLLPKELAERVRMTRQFEQETANANKAGASEEELGLLAELQRARLAMLDAAAIKTTTAGFYGGSGGRGQLVQGIVKDETNERLEKLLKANTKANEFLERIQIATEQFSALGN